jgi:hypothetical protein
MDDEELPSPPASPLAHASARPPPPTPAVVDRVHRQAPHVIALGPSGRPVSPTPATTPTRSRSASPEPQQQQPPPHGQTQQPQEAPQQPQPQHELFYLEAHLPQAHEEHEDAAEWQGGSSSWPPGTVLSGSVTNRSYFSGPTRSAQQQIVHRAPPQRPTLVPPRVYDPKRPASFAVAGRSITPASSVLNNRHSEAHLKEAVRRCVLAFGKSDAMTVRVARVSLPPSSVCPSRASAHP